MHETELKAFERIEKLNVLRSNGYVPGVLYGEGYEKGTPVKFENSNLTKIVHTHGASAKVWVDFNGNRKFGFIKELQKNSLSGNIIHCDIQVVSQNDEIRMKLPIVFNGTGELEHRHLSLHIYHNKVDVSGRAEVLPEVVTVDAGNLQLDDSIKAKDLHLSDGIKVHDAPNEIFAMVVEVKSFDTEEKTAAAEEAKE